ncbi:MAG: alpha-glucan family phosphorylase [Bacillota bacterium]
MSENKPKVAYFCMEFGLQEDFRIYAGGLGILAGDILKAARERGYPMIGVGILWRRGYTRQFIGGDGKPYDVFTNNDYLYNYLEDTGIEVSVTIRKREVKCKVWKTDQFNNNTLYLLDTNHPENDDRWITGRLYGGFEEERIAQEMVLGIGGVRALKALEEEVDLYHFNDGHPVLAGLELIKDKLNKGMVFSEALRETRKEIVFTTHTPVKAGNETHSYRVMRYMQAFNGLTEESIVEIGDFPFNMTVAGLKLAKIVNGVSELHGKTARKMWGHIKNKAPIIAITNGIHQKTWVDGEIINRYKNNEDIWERHQQLKEELIAFVQKRNDIKLSQDKLLIGFARRAATYKRADLIFGEMEKLQPYLETGKIQLVFSGKAYPLDDGGKELVGKIVEMSRKFPQSVVYLEDYNMEVAEYLTKGVDVWLNTPRRPQEASGTSGMKAAMNGVLNLSILDGWWPEACQHGENGWQFGDGYEAEDQDEHDLKALYEVLLNEVISTYYENRDKWCQMMGNSIESTYNKFSAKKMLDKYYEKMYNYNEEKENGGY